MAETLEVKVPDIGDFTDVPVIEVLVAEGDTVEAEAPLITLESDKATMEVPAPKAGVVRGLKVKVGDKVAKGVLILSLEVAGDSKPAAAAPAKAPPPASKPASTPAAAPAAPAPTPVAASAPPTGGASLTVTVPDIGDFTDVPVIEVLVAEGDTVEAEAPLITLESDKATMEVPAPTAGVVRGLKVKVGDKVSKGMPICTLEGAAPPQTQTPGAAAAAAPALASASGPASGPAAADDDAARRFRENFPATAADSSVPSTPGPAPRRGGLPHASPAIRKFARELGVELGEVVGSGPKGRVTREDVQGFVKQRMRGGAAPAVSGGGIPQIPVVDFAQFGPVEQVPLARIRKLSAAHLHRAWLNVPHVTQTDEADITELEAFRKAASTDGAKLTLLPFVLKACAHAIRAYPEFGASLAPDGAQLIMKKYIHIGFAAETEHGLVVPVVRDVDRKGVTELAQECAILAKRARDGKLKPEEMKGGVFSVSSLGGIGGSHFTPIVNAPEVGILGVSRAQMKPVWDGKAFNPRMMVPLSLSYDHRVIDGAYAARFIVLLAKLLSDVRRLVL